MIRKPSSNFQESTTHMVIDDNSADSVPDTNSHIENRLLNCIGLKHAEELIGKCHDSKPMNYKVGDSERAQGRVVFPRAHQPNNESDGGASEESPKLNL
jgi:hypothetical protein